MWKYLSSEHKRVIGKEVVVQKGLMWKVLRWGGGGILLHDFVVISHGSGGIIM